MPQETTWLRERFGRIYPGHVSGFARLLTTLRRHFDGDLDMMLVLTVIGERRYALRQPPEALRYEEAGRAPLHDPGATVINIQSVSDYTGIPRETVRRKVAALIARGWVSRDENGDLTPTTQAATDLRAATEATMAYISHLVALCDAARRDRG